HNTFKVVDPETNKELKYGERGEICFFGPTMMLGYYKNSEDSDKVIRIQYDVRKWIHSHDFVYIDEDGVVFIVDRIKRMIVRPDGHNVFPAQIEAVLLQHPSVEQCCVVGLKNPNGENGKIPTAFVVLKENASDDALEKDLDTFSKERLPERDVAMQYRFIEKLPLTPVGKVDYRALEKEAENT
ncbi:MAG: long-chain fatty acid--CoA ligase, partial [Clostridiales bacterium]|nr:long-chain fatty acid--CoA ligase [Candidatus Coliplasma equi]